MALRATALVQGVLVLETWCELLMRRARFAHAALLTLCWGVVMMTRYKQNSSTTWVSRLSWLLTLFVEWKIKKTARNSPTVAGHTALHKEA